MDSLGIVIPYRDRQDHLDELLPALKKHIHQSHVTVIVEQVQGKAFNRAKLMNIGFDILKDICSHFCFHDVDLVPIDVDYSLEPSPRRLCKKIEGYPSGNDSCFGGVIILSKADFLKINGFSNDYWGWGEEDNDIRDRCVNMNIKRHSVKVGHFQHLKHGEQRENKNSGRFSKMQNKSIDFLKEGFNGLEYEILLRARQIEPIHVVVKI